MFEPKKQLTAEEIFHARAKNAKKRDRKKQATARAKAEDISSRLGISSTTCNAQDQKFKAGGGACQTLKQTDLDPEPHSVNWDQPAKQMDCDTESQPVDRHQPSQQVMDANAGWPWVGVPAKLLTQAPYALNEHNAETGFFTLPREVQTSPLFNVPRGMEQPILRILFEYHGCASKFAATCQAAFNLVASSIDHWDFSRGGFNGCDKPLDDNADHTASVGKVVVVSQFRVRKWRGENYACDMYGLQNMARAFVNFADRFEVLHLHRIPLLTTHLLEMVIPLMRSLKVLGVYRCELIHFGDTTKLLEIVRINRDTRKNHRVKLDFYPRFHIGPVHVPGKDLTTGSYGVTWDNFSLDSRLAIWQRFTKILPQAKRQGVDLISSDSAFRLWVEQSPCWRVSDTIKAIERGDDGIKLALQVDYPKSRGIPAELLKGDPWRIKKYYCCQCREDILGIFFDFEEYTQHAWFCHPKGSYIMLCLGCKLTKHLCGETDHRKAYKRRMVKCWLGDPDVPIKASHIYRALRKTAKKRGMDVAVYCDTIRKEEESENPGPERQRPYWRWAKYSPNTYDVESTSYW